ncbi:MAG: hypothetical protein K0U98_09775 [Deltaproteobacteria bacterium]|nr:hypothetical protein [Deltaproteobacteria bacterium]
MRTPDLNLSQRPFLNTRPVTRLAIALGILGCLLLVANLAQYWRFFSGSEERRAELTEAELRVADQEKEVARLKASLNSFDLFQQNDQVDFLNRKIAERTFSWSHLFDRLAEVLPADVRLNTLSPRPEGLGSEFGEVEEVEAGEPLGDRAVLGIVGEAKTVEAELEFIDRLFEHPSFERPRLLSDANQQGLLRFQISVLYFPDRQASSEKIIVASSGEGENTGREAGGGPSREPSQTRTGLPSSSSPLAAGSPQRAEAGPVRLGASSTTPSSGDVSDGVLPRELGEAVAGRDRSGGRDNRTSSRSRPGSSRPRTGSSNRRQLTNPRSGGVPQQGLTVGLPIGGTSGGASNPGAQTDSNPLTRGTRGTDRRRPRRPPEPPQGPDRTEPSLPDREDDRPAEQPTPRRPSASAPLEIQ